MSHHELRCPLALRAAGQRAIGTALSLYFTPAVVAILAEYSPYLAAGVVFALTLGGACGWLLHKLSGIDPTTAFFALTLGGACGWLLHKLSGIDPTTAFFAMAVGGASEMATQSERHGAAVDRVAAARIACAS